MMYSKSRRLLLVIDDDKAIDFLKGFFLAHEYKIDLPPSFEESIKFLEKNDYDVVFFDDKSVDFNQKAFLKAVSKRNEEAELALLANGTLKECEQKMLSYGAGLYLPQPLDFGFAARRLNKVVEQVQKKDVYERSFYKKKRGTKTPKAKLMFVDDEIDACEFLEKHFRGPAAGGIYEIAVAYNGAEALQKAKKFKPDIVITDVKMPGMRGTDMVEAFRALKNPPKDFIIITAIDSYEQRERAERARLTLFEKPIELRELVDTIREKAIAHKLTID